MRLASQYGAMPMAQAYTVYPGWISHRELSNPSVAALAWSSGSWDQYASFAITSNYNCILVRDPGAGSTNNLVPSNSVVYDGDTWLYQAMGNIYYDQCSTFAGNSNSPNYSHNPNNSNYRHNPNNPNYPHDPNNLITAITLITLITLTTLVILLPS
jgi:hypothetical protein